MNRSENWIGTVVKKSRGLLDGSNLYRWVTVQTDAGGTRKVRVDRHLWQQLQVGDRLIKDAETPPRRP